MIRGLVAAFVHNPVLANLIAAGVLVGGLWAAYSLPRETFPETSINYAVVTVPYPGASPEDVEQGVTVKIEQALQGIPGVWEISSRTDENVVYLGAAYDPKVTPTAEMLRIVQNRVSAITTLPAGAEKPIVADAIFRNSVINVGVHGPVPEAVIKQVAEQVRDDLLADPGISQVTVSGVRDSEISIQVSEEALQRHGLALQQVIEAVSRSSLDLPAGTIRTRHEEISIRTTGRRLTAADFKDLVVMASPHGTSVRLGQLAEVREGFEDTPLIGRIDGEPGATVHVLKTGQEDLSGVAAKVREYVQSAQRKMPEGVRLTLLADKSHDVDARINMLIGNGLMGIALLLGCLLLFMDFRAAVGVAMGLPVAMAGALVVMSLTGQTLNLISLFGLIMADAIVLDDSIIIADSVLAREREGMTPALAAIEGTRRVTMPVINASLTTLIMFVPMMFVEGVMGKLIYVLPVVVVASIVASLAEAFFVLPAHLCEWTVIRKPRTEATWRTTVRKQLDRWIDLLVTRLYRATILRLIGARWVVLSASTAVLLICIGVVWGGRTPFVLFPKLDCNSLRARVRLPEGTPIAVTQAVVAQLEQAALGLNDDPTLKPAAEGKLVRHLSSIVGEWPDYVSTRGSGLCETIVELMPSEQRRIDVALILEKWRQNAGTLPYGASLTMTREELGPQEKPIEIRLLGDDLAQLRQAADELEGKLGEFSGVFDVTDDLIPGKREWRVVPKPEARNLGLTVGDLAYQLRQGLYGGEAVRVQRGREEVKVMVSYADSDRRSLSAIQNLRIRTHTGASVPFSEVADTHMTRGYSSIGRQDGYRRIRVQADVQEHYANAEQIVQALERSFLPQVPERFPGVTFRIDGERKRMSQSLASLVQGFIVALVATYVVLGAALRSYVQPLILMTAVPLGITGAILGHTVLGYDLSLMSVFGMTSVAGIVVNDALVLMDQVNHNLSSGMGVRDAVVQGSESRVVAVFLTAITNVAGMAPLLLDRSSQAVTLIPIAVSVAFGLCFAMALTLFIVPAMYMGVNDLRRFVYWVRHGGLYPSPERVEPVHTVAV